jgi:predicted permease
MNVLTDIRQSVRSLARSPGFAGMAILTLALAIGANTAIYSALRSLVLHPLPFRDADRLVFLWHRNPAMGGVLVTPPGRAIEQWRADARTFDAVESLTSRAFVMTGSTEPESVTASVIRPTLLTMLAVRPAMGRAFTAEDTLASAPAVALISDDLWRRRFAADPTVIGKTLTLSDQPYVVVGVMPASFHMPMGADTLWIPARAGAIDDAGQNTIARLQPGVTAAAAQAELDRLGALNAADPDLKGWTGVVMSPGDQTGVGRALFVMTGAVGLLLLIACVNVANLMLSRFSARQREVAIRHALGASRGRLVRTLLAESLVLAAAGGGVGLLLAQWILAAMAALRPRQLDAIAHVRVDGPVLAFAAAVSIATSLLVGLLPALRAARVDLQRVLAAGGRGVTAVNHRFRQGLSVVQIAVALVLLVGATLLLRSFARLTAVDTGINPAGVVAMRVTPPPGPAARRAAFYDDLLGRVAVLPGVTAAAVGQGLPPENGILVGTLQIDGREPAKAPSVLSGGSVTPAYFSLLGIRVLSGRTFTADDRDGSEPVAVVSESFASRYWPDGHPIGARFRLDANDRPATIVGVVGNVRANDLGAGGVGDLQVYFPRAQTHPTHGVIVAKASGDPRALVPALKAQVWAVDPKLPVQEVATAEDLVARSAARARFNLALLSAFALCGLLLAAVGVYGVMALFVGQRRDELGLRLALGATPAALAGLVLRQTAVVVLVGMTLGAAGALAFNRVVASLLFNTESTDPASYAVALAAVGLSALLATAVPVVRAARVDPVATLRGGG